MTTEAQQALPKLVPCPRCLQLRMRDIEGLLCCDACKQQEIDEDAAERAAIAGESAAPAQSPSIASAGARRGQPTPGKRSEAPAPAPAKPPAPAPAPTSAPKLAPAPTPEAVSKTTPAAAPAPAKTPPPATGAAIEKGRQVGKPAPAAGWAPKIVTGADAEEALKFMFYGEGGVGKTSVMISIPNLLLIEYEHTPGLPATQPRVEGPRTLVEWNQLVRWLRTAEHPYKAVGIDTGDEWEAMIFRAAVERSNVRKDKDQPKDAENIEHVGGGYKKGYTSAIALMREALADLEQLRQARGITIAFSAHQRVEKRRNPEGEDFDHYTTALHPDVGRSLIYDWTDATFRCAKVIKTARQGKKGKAKGVGGDERVLVTDGRDAWQAKNRFDLPLRMPLDWRALEAAIAQWRSPIALRQAIDEALAFQVDAERVLGDLVIDVKGTGYVLRDLVEHQLGKTPSRQLLAQVKNRLEARVAVIETAREEAEAAAEAGGE